MKNLYVFPNLRGMQAFLQKNKEGSLLNVLTMKDFFTQALFVKGKRKAPKILQKIFLMQVFNEFDFSDSQKQFLFFEYNFLGFLETSPFLFKLFSEAFESRVEIKKMMQMDIYGEYEDHLSVIERIYQCYQEKLEFAGYYDFPHQAEIFWDFLNAFDRIEFFIDGFLSSFELDLLSQIAQKIEVFLHLSIDSFNHSYFLPLSSSFKPDHTYTFSLSSKEIITSSPKELKSVISLEACDFRIDECSAVIDRVNRWLKENVNPEKIAVVVPNHDFLPILMACDEGKNFNYAMGKKSDFIRQCEKLSKMECASEENPLESLIAGVECCIRSISPSVRSRVDKVLLGLEQNADFLQDFSFQDLVLLFLQEVQNITEEDNQGGRVRVIEILETRGIEFEKVIVVDFNQDNIPTLSSQDMFLNTAVRQGLGMPTIKDKQNLQKHYYLELFKNTQQVEILFIKGQMANFVREIGLMQDFKDDQEKSSLFPPHQNYEYQEDQIQAEIASDMKFSSTSLEVFQECKRRFYFRFIRHLEEEMMQKSLSDGIEVHTILQEAYRNTLDFSQIKNQVMREIAERKERAKDNQSEMRLRIIAYELGKFLDFEVANPPSKILDLEKSFSFNFEGYEFGGRIDRIDQKEDEIRIIDYKYTHTKGGSFKLEPHLLQAVIYYLYAKERFKEKKIGVYIAVLKDGKYESFSEELLQKGIDQLKELLDLIKQERKFPKVDKRSVCNRCAYKILCNR